MKGDIQPVNQQIKRTKLFKTKKENNNNNNNKIIMAQYNNSTRTPDEWKLDHNSIPFREGLIVIFMFLYGLKIQL